MNHEDLLDAVTVLARPETLDGTERARFAVLQTLGEHVTAGEAEELATDAGR